MWSSSRCFAAVVTAVLSMCFLHTHALASADFSGRHLIPQSFALRHSFVSVRSPLAEDISWNSLDALEAELSIQNSRKMVLLLERPPGRRSIDGVRLHEKFTVLRFVTDTQAIVFEDPTSPKILREPDWTVVGIMDVRQKKFDEDLFAHDILRIVRNESRADLLAVSVAFDSVPSSGPFLAAQSVDVAEFLARLTASWSAFVAKAAVVHARTAVREHVVLIQTRPGVSRADVATRLSKIPRILWIEPFETPRRTNFESYKILLTASLSEHAMPVSPFYPVLTGRDVLVSVVDDGLDYGSCFFYDPVVEVPAVVSQIENVSTIAKAGKHRKVQGIWSFMDASWSDRAHGTHTSGTASGEFQLPSSTDSPAIDALVLENGISNRTRILYSDIGCDQFAGCRCQATDESGVRIPCTCDFDAGGLCPSGTLGIPLKYGDHLFRFSTVNGASVISNSWGDDIHTYSLIATSDIDGFVFQNRQVVVVFAAGNAGARATISSQGHAKNVITVGASRTISDDSSSSMSASSSSTTAATDTDLTTSIDTLAAFSSRGPTIDGRIKPDVVAPGDPVISARALPFFDSTKCGVGPRSDASDPAFHVFSLSGTSMATPAVASIAASVVEYLKKFYPHPIPREAAAASAFQSAGAIAAPSAALVKAIIVNSAVTMDGVYASNISVGGATQWLPLDPKSPYEQGFGRVLLPMVIPIAAANASSISASSPTTTPTGCTEAPCTGEPSALTLLVLSNENHTIQETGAAVNFSVLIPANTNSMRVTLVWTDPLPSSLLPSALVNDLDLNVSLAVGTNPSDGNATASLSHFGNEQYFETPDRVNNVERVIWRSPPPGQYLITVSGYSIDPSTLLLDGGAGQAFALVISYGSSGIYDDNSPPLNSSVRWPSQSAASGVLGPRAVAGRGGWLLAAAVLLQVLAVFF